MALENNVVHGDITERFPNFADEGFDTDDLTARIATAFEDIQDDLRSRGQDPDLIAGDDSNNFRKALVARTLWNIYRTLSDEAGDGWDIKAKEQKAAYEAAMNTVSYRLDLDEDDEPDSEAKTSNSVRIGR